LERKGRGKGSCACAGAFLGEDRETKCLFDSKRSLLLLSLPAPWLLASERAISLGFGALSRYCPEIKGNHALGQKAMLECVVVGCGMPLVATDP
jgi:hypothetical protein